MIYHKPLLLLIFITVLRLGFEPFNDGFPVIVFALYVLYVLLIYAVVFYSAPLLALLTLGLLVMSY